MCDTALRLAREKVAEWLATYMLNADSEQQPKSVAIADWLGNAKVCQDRREPQW